MNPYEKSSVKLQTFQWLRFGEIKPGGWMRAQMQRDLEHGFLGHLDKLVPSLIQQDDIYGRGRLTNAVQSKDLGVVSKEKEWAAQFLWWNSETQSNWRDGFVRTALLLEHPDFLPKVRAYIEHTLATQDPEGYLGIYAPDLRFNFMSENGELWAQASVFRVLLGYYEATGESRVLNAVLRAVNVTMREYPIFKSHPFAVKNDYAGVCHGLVLTDVLDRLYQLTGTERYLDYALWLYQEYSETELSADDIRFSRLTDSESRFHAHGVHTYEHLRSLLTAVYASSNPLLEDALTAYLSKLEDCLTPSGAPIGDEMIGGRLANASETGYEYCSLHELLDSYSHLLQKTGNPHWADRIEWLLFNAAHGARHPLHSAIAYLKTDNSYSMTGPLHPQDKIDEKNPQTRYKYSPVHQDVAVCCVPNAGRILPYYIKSMWMRSAEGLVAMLYGASNLQTEVNGAKVLIREETQYPFDLNITFTIEVSLPVEFELSFRKPAWATGLEIKAEGTCRQENGLVTIRKKWCTGDQIILHFKAAVKTSLFRDNEYFISHGPLLFALPLDGEEREGRSYPLTGFRDLYYFNAMSNGSKIPSVMEENFSIQYERFDLEHPWNNSIFILGQSSSIRLAPMGGTILRQVTFPRL
jgi:hypothetical protein